MFQRSRPHELQIGKGDEISGMAEILGIAAFDLDGTLLRGRTVCEILAEPLGRGDEMRRFETGSTQEEIVEARIAMAVWYRERDLRELQTYLCHACWAPRAQEGIAQLQDAGVEVAILSVTWGFAVRYLAAQLNVQHCLGTELLPNGEIEHCWGQTKADFLGRLMRQLQIPAERVAAIGDSSGDIPMLELAGLRFFIGKIRPEIPDALHVPGADIRTIADKILETWSHK